MYGKAINICIHQVIVETTTKVDDKETIKKNLTNLTMPGSHLIQCMVKSNGGSPNFHSRPFTLSFTAFP